jgi:hypothetical protein
MDAIFDALSTALNLSLYDTPFDDPENRRMIMDALDLLAQNAEALETHGEELNASFDYLRRSLARDANEAILRYRQQQYDGAQFVLDQLIDNCVSCHSKLPGEEGFELGRRFVDRARFDELPVDRRVSLLVATRQFEDALELYEAHFGSESTDPQEVAAGGMLADYLEIALTVLDDRRRAARTLESLARRKDVTRHLRGLIAEWVKVIEAPGDPAGAELASARRLVHEARRQNVFPADRRGLVHFVLATGVLQRFLESRPKDDEDIAEAYYLLGICESHTTRSIWVSETEFYLESAVRTAPASPFARLALDFLDAYVSAEYTGSSGVMVPESVRERIDELRVLIDRSRPER